MRVLLCGGSGTEGIEASLNQRFLMSRVDFIVEEHIGNIRYRIERGDYFDRAVIFQGGWTYDDNNADEETIRRRISDFVSVFKSKVSRESSCLFIAVDSCSAKIVSEETLEISARCKVLVNRPPYSVTFCRKLVSTDDYSERMLYQPEGIAETGEGDIIYSEGHIISGDGGELETVKDLEFDGIWEQDEDDDLEDEILLKDLDTGFFGDPNDAYGLKQDVVSDNGESDNEENAELEKTKTEADDTCVYDDEFDKYDEVQDELLIVPGEKGSVSEDLTDVDFEEAEETDSLSIADVNEMFVENGFDDNEYPDFRDEQSAYMDENGERDEESADSERERERRKSTRKLFPGRKKSGSRNGGPALKEEEDRVKEILETFRTRGNVLAVTGTSGSGVSTVAYNLANTIVNLNMEYSVLIVDLDTVNRAQAYMSRSAYDAVHSLDVENASLKQAINSMGVGVGRFVNILRPGLHLLTMGMGGDIVRGDKLAAPQKWSGFAANIRRGGYNFVIYDMPFEIMETNGADMVFTADNILLTCEASNHGMASMMLRMCNIDNEDLQELMFTRAGLCFTKYSGLKKVFGTPVSDVRQAMLRIDEEVKSLLGVDPEFYFSNMRVCATLPFDKRYEDGWFSDKQYSDYMEGRSEYVRLLKDILING